MTQPTTSYTFFAFYKRIGERVFNTETPTETDLTDSKRFVNEGYQTFLQSYNWSFMYPTASLTVAADDSEIDLPDNFGAIRGKVSRSADSQYNGLIEVAPDEIRRRRALNDLSSIPFLYALSPKAFVTATGQQWEMLIYPKSESEITLAFQYRVCANLLSADADYPLGGSLHSMTILQFAYAVWEQEKDGTDSIQSKNAQEALQRSIRIDNSFRSSIVNSGRQEQPVRVYPSIAGVE